MLARLVGLPPSILERAAIISGILTKKAERAKNGSKAQNIAMRRSLILKLKETLVQARDGCMEEEALKSWLMRVQEDFVSKMFVLTAPSVEDGSEDDEEPGEELMDVEDMQDADDIQDIDDVQDEDMLETEDSLMESSGRDLPSSPPFSENNTGSR